MTKTMQAILFGIFLLCSCAAQQEKLLLSQAERERIARQVWEEVFGQKPQLAEQPAEGKKGEPQLPAKEAAEEEKDQEPSTEKETPAKRQPESTAGKEALAKKAPKSAIRKPAKEVVKESAKEAARKVKEPAGKKVIDAQQAEAKSTKPAKNLPEELPARHAEPATPPKPRYPLVSLNAESIQLREAITLMTGGRYALAPGMGVDMYRPVTARFVDMPLDKALKVLLTPMDYSFKIDLQQKTIELSRFVVKTYEIPWLALEREGKIEIGSETESEGGQGGQGSVTAELTGNLVINSSAKQNLWEELEQTIGRLLSPAGRLTISKTIGMVTVGDTPSYMRRIDDFIARFKANIKKQAIISIEVFEVQFNKRDAYGVDWENIMTRISNAGANVTSISLGTGLSPGLAAGAASGVTVFGISDRVQGRTSTRTREAIFQALSTYGKVKMLSRPQLRVINNQVAYIGVGEVVPYLKSVERDISGTGGLEAVRPQIAQVRTGLTLMLTPFIQTEEKKITLEVAPLFNEIREFIDFDLGEGMKFSNPVVTTRQLVTMIEAKDGETIVMGGILLESAKKIAKRVPVLGSIPLVGKLFRGTDDSRSKVELVISLTPRILVL